MAQTLPPEVFIPSPYRPAEEAPGTNQPPMERAFPWLASFLLHLGLALLALFAYGVARHVMAARARPIIIPIAMNTAFHRNAGGIPTPGTKHDPLRQAKQQRERLMHASGFANKIAPNVSALLTGAGGQSISHMIAVGSTGGLHGHVGLGDSGGPMAPYGLGGGGNQAGLRSQIFGEGVNATRIVYVVDSSGALASVFHIVKQKVMHSVARMQPVQRFAVITFSDRYHFVGPPRLVRATARAKRRLRRSLLAVVAQGADTYSFRKFYRPLRAAFALRPQLIFFLTDGHFSAKLPPAIRRLNARQQVRIVAYACISRNAKFAPGNGHNEFTLPNIKRRLREIAAQNHGKFKVISGRDFFGGR